MTDREQVINDAWRDFTERQMLRGVLTHISCLLVLGLTPMRYASYWVDGRDTSHLWRMMV